MNGSEVWKDVAGYEGYYQVSNKGNVYSVERINSMGKKCGGRTLRPRYDQRGYFKVGLYKNGKMQNKLIHRLVAESFIPNPENHPEVNHRDEVKTNNELSNLEWCDKSYNASYGTRGERIAQAQSKKVRAVNVKTGEVLTFNSVREAGEKGYPSISQACRGVYKNANGKLIGGGRLYKGHKWYYYE